MSVDEMKKSKEYFEIAKKIIPGGVQNARRPGCFAEGYPIFNDRAKGAHFWDVDGHEYIDWMLSFGPIVLGHCNKEVDDAVREVIETGFIFNLTAPTQLTLAQKLIEHIPCAEKVITVATGSEATLVAIRTARIYTGKDIIVQWGYHGWFDWAITNHLGIPKGIYDDIKTFTYNDLKSLEKVLEQNKNKVAGIIMMPFEIVMPEPGFLEGVRKLADTYGAVLIFDEIRSWPRMGLGGAQKHFGVTPDITTLSKGIANGYTLSTVVGKADIMEAAAKSVISATYFPSTMPMVASLATIKQLEDKKVMDHIWKIAKMLGDGLAELVKSKKVNATVFGAPQMPFLMFGDREANIKSLNGVTMSFSATGAADSKGDEDKEKIKAQLLADKFYSETVKRGIFFHPKHHWFSCLAHTEEDVKKTLKASEEALDIALKSI